MASPGSATPHPSSSVDTIPPRGDAPQTKVAIFSPLCPEQEDFLRIISNPFSEMQQEVARNVAKQLGISYSSGQGDVVEDID